MTTFNVEGERADELIRASLRVGLRMPTENQGAPGATVRTFVYTPDLTPAEQLLLRTAAGAVALTNAERNGMQPDLDLLATFQGIATPTLAQTAAATKAQSRILRALLRS